jgi:hypothetical protein
LTSVVDVSPVSQGVLSQFSALAAAPSKQQHDRHHLSAFHSVPAMPPLEKSGVDVKLNRPRSVSSSSNPFADALVDASMAATDRLTVPNPFRQVFLACVSP